jgi:tetratricopeptide (TPR) repeat protein
MPSRPALWPAAVALAVVAVAGGAVALAERPPAPQPLAAAAVTGRAGALADRAALTAHLRDVPGDWQAWNTLGAVELERGRATQDPQAYDAADRAFGRSLAVEPEDNAGALAGRAALAAARHDFGGAERQAWLALAVNPMAPDALAALTDALTELGRYDEALAAAQRLDAVRPGVASFSRLSYQAELRGDTARARALMDDAAAGAGTSAQAAFAHSQRGLLALGAGDLAGADAAWRAGTSIAPGDADLAALGARIAWARGDRPLALRRWAEAVERRPSSANLAGHAEALAADGRGAEAERLFGVVRTMRQLAARSGVATDAADVLFDADHGDPSAAVRSGGELYRRAPSTAAADAYAWALHAAGRDAEALAFADRALALGGRPASTLAHRGLIRAALGQRATAAADLRAALRGGAQLSPPLAAQARAQLAPASS